MRPNRRDVVAREAGLTVVVALAQIAGTAVAANHHQSRGSLGVAGIVLLAAAAAAVPFRRRFPAGALTAALCMTAAYSSLGYPRGPIFFALIITFVNAVLRGRRGVAVASLVVGFIAFEWLGVVIGRETAPGWGS